MSRLAVSFRHVMLASALMLAACQQGPSEPPPLAGAAIGGPFTLINQQGKPVSDTDFKGKYRMVYFGYTWCPDICPTDMQQLGKAFRAFEAKHPDLASKVQPIFISVDPGRDTPDKIAPFVAAFHPRFIGLTGTPAQIDAVTRAYAIPVLKGDDDGSGNYLVDHGRMTFLMDPDGKPMALLTPDKGADTVTADLEKWVR